MGKIKGLFGGVEVILDDDSRDWHMDVPFSGGGDAVFEANAFMNDSGLIHMLDAGESWNDSVETHDGFTRHYYVPREPVGC